MTKQEQTRNCPQQPIHFRAHPNNSKERGLVYYGAQSCTKQSTYRRQSGPSCFFPRLPVFPIPFVLGFFLLF